MDIRYFSTPRYRYLLSLRCQYNAATNFQNSCFAVIFDLEILMQVSEFRTFTAHCVQLHRDFLQLNCSSDNTGRLSGVNPPGTINPMVKVAFFSAISQKFHDRGICSLKIISWAENGAKTCFVQNQPYLLVWRVLLQCKYRSKWLAKILQTRNHHILPIKWNDKLWQQMRQFCNA